MTPAVLALALLLPAAPAGDDDIARVEALAKGKGGTVQRDEKAPGRPVTNVILVGAKLTDADLAPLAGVTTLEGVSLGYNPALTHDPHFLPARVGLGELYLKAGNAAGAAAESAALRELGPEGAAEAAVLEARGLTAAGDHPGAAALLEAAAKEFPGSVGVRVALSHARLACGSPPDVLEAALRAVLELDPANPRARHTLRVLVRNTGRHVGGVIDPPPG